MWKSVIYKEWIKIKWFLILFAALGVLTVGYIFLKVQHDFKFNDANNYWYLIMFQGIQFFSYLKFIPIAGALAISIAQYFPETVSKRIKLTFHLPINENKVLLMMMLFGIACLLAIYILLLVVFYGLSTVYFPSDIIVPALTNITPWFLAGFAIYYFVALVVLEPVWKYRFLYIVVAAAFFPIFLESSLAGAYAPANPLLAVLVIALSISLLFSGYRFRKGEM
ncbi:MAG: ABC transporter permease [Draconibacterium sp.]|nr:ABC transporter permease [Draconibacterium sp.]